MCGEMTFIDGTVNACRNTKVLADRMHPISQLGRIGTFQHDNDPKHTAENHTRVSKEKKSENYDQAKHVRESINTTLERRVVKRMVERHNPSSNEQRKIIRL